MERLTQNGVNESSLRLDLGELLEPFIVEGKKSDNVPLLRGDGLSTLVSRSVLGDTVDGESESREIGSDSRSNVGVGVCRKSHYVSKPIQTGRVCTRTAIERVGAERLEKRPILLGCDSDNFVSAKLEQLNSDCEAKGSTGEMEHTLKTDSSLQSPTEELPPQTRTGMFSFEGFEGKLSFNRM